MIIFHNGAFIPDTNPVLSIHDRARLGECVFSTMLAVDGRIHHARAHTEKLLKNSKLFWGQWAAPSVDTLMAAAQELLVRGDALQGRHAVNIILTGGQSGNGIRSPQPPEPQILMRALPLVLPGGPVQAIIARSTRRNEHSPLSRIKGAFYGDNILALREAADKGANEAILLATNGYVSCATTASLLIVQGGALYTPPLSDGGQDGLTRTLAIEKLRVRERSFTPEDLRACEGIYLINSLRGAVPLASLDGVALPVPTLTLDPDFHIQ
jgi:branched-chain amino acid aminotransferase